MSDRQFMQIDDDWALASDGVQWILQRRHQRKGRADTWDGVSFVRSTREVLARCMREKGVPTPAATRLLALLPERFDDWVRYSDFSARPAVEEGPRAETRPAILPAANAAGPDKG
jgi:hypothetical protein